MFACIEKNRRVSKLVDHIIVSLSSILVFFRVLGGTPSDIHLAWVPWNDLYGWYTRALILKTSGTPISTPALGFPAEFRNGAWGTLGFDGLNLGVQWGLIKLGASPIVSTNLLIVGLMLLGSALSLYLLHLLAVNRIMCIIGSLLLSTLPFTFIRIAHINIAFVWPYIGLLVILFSLFGLITVPRTVVVALGVAIGSSGSYSFIYILIVIAAVSAAHLLATKRRLRPRGDLAALFVVGVMLAVFLYVSALIYWPSPLQTPNINKIRSLSEASLWQGWHLSLFLPGPFSGIPGVSKAFSMLNELVFAQMDPSSLCVDSWVLQSVHQEWGCRRLVDSLAFNSIASLVGNWITIGCVMVSVFHANPTSVEGRRFPPGFQRSHLEAIKFASIAWLVVVFSSSFGFGLLVFRVFPGARAWGRMYLIALVCSVLIFVLILNYIFQVARSRAIRAALFALVAVLVIDQTSYSLNVLGPSRLSQTVYSRFASVLSSEFATDCPLVLFPSNRYAIMSDTFSSGYFQYNDLSLALYAPQFRWSSGMSSSEQPDQWPKQNSPFASEDERHEYFNKLVSRSHLLGACGFVVDKSPGSGVSDWDESFLVDQIRKHGLKYDRTAMDFMSAIRISD